MGQREEDCGDRAQAEGHAAARCNCCRDTVGDPFKDTSSVALNPIIKFTTLFGLLAVELAVSLSEQQGPMLGHFLSAAFLLVALIFIWRSFYRMRIERQG